ncbi:MAG: DUF2281 domain-containing protein [Candidatus Electronema sp. VV]
MDNIAREFAALPPEAKQQVVDFVEFIKKKYAAATKKAVNLERAEEPFIGMWRDRDDMRDSSAWVKKTRNSEWAIKDV